MKFADLNKKSIQRAFNEFDKNNPKVYELFKKYAFELIRKNKKTSSKLIINRIRWEIYIETIETNDNFRINDAYTSRYVRKFIREFPEHAEKFKLRKLRSPEDIYNMDKSGQLLMY